MAWLVRIDFQGGAGWEDITSSVVMPSFVRRRQLWNKLRPTVNTLDFKLKTESASLIAKFMVASDDILVSVTKDGTAYFTGMVQPNYSVTVGGRIGPFDISCVDNGYRLQRRILANINWTSYKVCNPAATTTSILHQLMVAAGLTTSAVFSSIVTINKTIDRFVGIAGESNVWDMVSDILYEFGYTFYFRPDGTLNVHYFAPTTITSTGTFSSDTSRNIIGSLKVERNVQDYEAVRVKWATHKTLTNVLLFSETSGGDAVRKCNLDISSAAYWPTGSNIRDIYADYRVDGMELVATSAVVLNMENDAAVVQDTFTDEILRAKIKFHNSGATSAYIRRFDITGDAIVKDQYNIQVRIMASGTNKYLDIDSRYIYLATDAGHLCDAVAQYYYNADMRYMLRSRTEYDPGTYVDVEETGFLDIDNQCVVQEVVDNEWTGEHQYVLEGVAAYTAGSVTGEGSGEVPLPFIRPSAYVIGVSGYTGFADVYLDGAADQAKINAGILLAQSYSGTVNIVGVGTVVLSASIEMQSSVTLMVDPGVVIEKNCDDYAIECVGTSGTHKINAKVCGTGKVTREAGDTYAKPLVYFDYTDESTIEGITVDASYGDGVYLLNCTRISLGGALNIKNCAGTGLKIVNSIVAIAAAITISACAIGYVCLPSMATDKISYGNCESTNEPMLDNETTPSLFNCTWARNNTLVYSGSYAYRIVTSAALGRARLVDAVSATDMHGLTAGKTYMFRVMVQTTTVGTVPFIVFDYYVGGGGFPISAGTPITVAAYGKWVELFLIVKLPATATGVELACGSGVTTGTSYFDEIAVYEFDAADSGCQLVNSSIADCTEDGVRIINSHVQVQNNQVTGCGEKGFNVIAGYRNVLSGNRAFNNGADTGGANDNYDNYIDTAVDTESSGNSWNHLPVTGQPSLGTPHPAPLNGTNLRQIYSGIPATTASTTEVDVSAYVPVGTKAIHVVGAIKTGSNTLDYLRASKTSAANYDNAIWPVQGYGGVAFQYYPISGIIYLDSNRKFWLWKSSGGVAGCDLWINFYFI